MLEFITSLLVAHSTPESVLSKPLAAHVMFVAEQLKVDPVLLTKIIIVESRAKANAVNMRTNDWGLMQIHVFKGQSVNYNKLLNWPENVWIGARILKKYSKRADFRPCMFNTGPNGTKRNNGKNCLQYEAKLDKVIL